MRRRKGMRVLKGYFNKESDYNSFLLLRILKLSDKPVGSWILKERMAESEVNLSLATIGRLLKELDQKKYTRLISSQGREITSNGKVFLTKLERNITRFGIENEVMQASNPNSYEEIIDLLHARKAIEVETIRLAVLNATKEDIELLEQSIASHKDCMNKGNGPGVLAINFHVIVAEISCNRFLSSALKLLIHEEIEMERKFPELASQLRAAHHIFDHKLIVETVKEQNVEKAMRYMSGHMDKLIQSISN
jgi:hypothetical protein